jgi:hypothetical protein
MDTYFELKFIHERGPRPRQSEAMPSIQGKIKTFMDKLLKRSMNLKINAVFCFSAILFFSNLSKIIPTKNKGFY